MIFNSMVLVIYFMRRIFALAKRAQDDQTIFSQATAEQRAIQQS